MDFLKKRTLYLFSYLYLYIPVCIFLLAWIKPFVSIPLVILSAYYLFKSIGNHNEQMSFWKGNKAKIILIIAVILLWVLLSGIGGFMWQNRWDHMFRNAIFNDLTTYSWPVINTDGQSPLILCYYIGFWLPSALLVKITGIAMIGYIGQFIWASAGIILSFFLISEWLKKVSYITIFVFVFFSGLDIIIIFSIYNAGFKEIFDAIIQGKEIDGLLWFFKSLSNTNSLFWVYNQIIPFWIGFMLIILQKNSKYIFFTFGLLFFTSPFPFVSMIPLVLYLAFKRDPEITGSFINRAVTFIKNQLSIQNFTTLAILIILALYFQSNLSTGKVSIVPLDKRMVWLFINYLVLEFIVFLPFVYKYVKKDIAVFSIVILTMIGCSFIQIGESGDFAWRTSVIASFYLMLLVIRTLTDNDFKLKSVSSILLIFILIIGTATPLCEMVRTMQYTFTPEKVLSRPLRSDGIESVFTNDIGFYENFVGKSDTFFYEYLIRK